MYKELKSNLKELANKITETKKECKEYQREHYGCDGGFYYKLWKLSREFRHKHIAYCLLKGTDRELIEKPSEDNRPDETWIQRIYDEHKKTIENVCVGS